ncbi:type I-E CRISPR-associated protein Cse2/CasB [Streptacidiphilus cavernicola]|uniref:Type I-E CRISPR-associated protein Cse2/CasB n=1 Tax=Streptacidiphilus cavernicola TaxID=3342716 RepID=A0ABV6W539_9ACTN
MTTEPQLRSQTPAQTQPPTPTRVRTPTAPLGTVGTVVGAEVKRLQSGYLRDRPDAVAALARLRRGAGKDAAGIADLWGLIDLQTLYTDMTLRQEEAENAVYAAMALWALHQQSRSTGMHRPGGDELGTAVRRLMPPGEILEPIRKRFVRAGAAPTLAALAVKLREITTLLRVEEISLDYALLADQLYRWQLRGGPDEVRRSWGRSFHAHRPKTAADPAATADPAAAADPTADSDPDPVARTTPETDPKDTP